MRSIVFIFLFYSQLALGQSNDFDIYARHLTPISNFINGKDTLEKKYLLYNLSMWQDTLAVRASDADYNGSIIKNLQLVTYFFDSSSVKCISFRDGRRGYFYFFFEDNQLLKVRAAKKDKIVSVFFYSSERRLSSDVISEGQAQQGISQIDHETLKKFASLFISRFKAK